ncbi:hypothetical protein [Leifsonia sp. EB34]|uniref:hypothetical protein n=1 Tax=Leifsonia sp. EB34 TaxID=3156303 RepID=UPI0035175BEF
MKHRALDRAFVTLLTILTLTGCSYTGGIMTNPNDDVLSPPNGLSTKSHAELLDETIKHTDDLVQLLGGEWLDLGVPPNPFDPSDLNPWRHPDPCDMNGVAEQYSIDLRQRAPEGTEIDPFAAVAKVRAHWKSLGYAIRQIGPPEQSTTYGHSIIVDQPRKGAIAFFASTQVLSISVQSECFAIER